MPDVNDMKQERAQLKSDARKILDTAQEAGRDMSGEEEQEFDRLLNEADKVDKRIKQNERVDDVPEDPDPDDGHPRGEPREGGEPESEDVQRSRAFNAFLEGRQIPEQQARALNLTSDPEGGYLVAPEQFMQQLIQKVDDEVPLRPLATTMTLTEGESLGVPTLSTDLNDAEWTSEVADVARDDSLRFGKRSLAPHPLAKEVLASRTLLRRGSLSAEEIVRSRMAYVFATAEENAFMTGDGSQKPLGLFTASDLGISTSRDVNTGASGGFSGDGLIDAKYTLKQQYIRNARWLFHRDSIKEVRKLKDANNQYLWQPGLAGDRPDTILDRPFVLSEFVPNTITDGNYVGMFGDFSFYWIVDSLMMSIQRLNELYAKSNQVGFIGRTELDAMPVLEEAFVRLKVGA